MDNVNATVDVKICKWLFEAVRHTFRLVHPRVTLILL